MNNEEERAKEFLKCLGNGKTIYQCEEENDLYDEEEKTMTTLKCLSCGKEIEVIPPCFIQMCKECIEKVDWGEKDGKRTE